MILSIVNEAILPVWLLWVLGGSIGSILVIWKSFEIILISW